jgi:hypothetical protein
MGNGVPKVGRIRKRFHENVVPLLRPFKIVGQCLKDSPDEDAWIEEITRRAELARAYETAGMSTGAVHAEARRIIEGA